MAGAPPRGGAALPPPPFTAARRRGRRVLLTADPGIAEPGSVGGARREWIGGRSPRHEGFGCLPGLAETAPDQYHSKCAPPRRRTPHIRLITSIHAHVRPQPTPRALCHLPHCREFVSLAPILAPSAARRQRQSHRNSSICSFSWLLSALLLGCSALLAEAACPRPPGYPGAANWIDPSTPDDACTKSVCTGGIAECTAPGAATEDMVLVFSDEFSDPGRDFVGQGGDPKWTAMDMYYSSDYREWQNYKPDKVAVKDGALHITFAAETTDAILNSVDGPVNVRSNKTSGMVQSWQKFCFTGGYVEFSVKLPGNARDSGLWAATWLQGNLGRAGYLRSTAGRWPYSYDECEGSGRLEWSDQPGQRVSRCRHAKGRGAPEIDVLEYGIFKDPSSPAGADAPTFVHTMQMAPVAPPFTSWMREDPPGSGRVPGVYLNPRPKGAGSTYMGKFMGDLTREGYPRTGNKLTDTYTASTVLRPSHFGGYQRFAVLWEPGEYVRWFLNDELLFAVDKEALRAQSNDAGESVGARLVPREAMYLIVNLAMANSSWSRVDAKLLASLPAVMAVDHVRVWQRRGAVDVGCDPPAFPTAAEVACNRDEYLSPSEAGKWRLGVCDSIGSQDNTLLLAVGTSAFAIAVGAAGMMWAMSRRLAAAEEGEGKLSPEERRAASASGGGGAAGREGGCYLQSRSATEVERHLAAVRPDLLQVARAQAVAAVRQGS